MPITGVYFIPSQSNTTTVLPTLTERLRTAYPDQDLVPVGRWALDHKLMRDTPGLLPASAQPQRPPKPQYMQFLSLTHYPTHGFICTSEPAENPSQPPASAPTPGATPSGPNANTTESPMVMTTVPPASHGTLFQHFVYAAQPFWCHRLTMAVPAGVVYDVGDFRVRMGDVRQTYPTARIRGTVVEIEWRGPSVVEGFGAGKDEGIEVEFAGVEEADVDAEYAATAQLIREFWNRLRFEGARESILVPGVGKEVKEKLKRGRGEKKRKEGEEAGTALAGGEEEDPDPSAGADVARQYMEVLRFNR